MNDVTKLNALLTLGEIPLATTTEIARHENVSQSYIATFLKKVKSHPYMIHLMHELRKDDPNRRLQFYEIFMRYCHRSPILKPCIF